MNKQRKVTIEWTEAEAEVILAGLKHRRFLYTDDSESSREIDAEIAALERALAEPVEHKCEDCKHVITSKTPLLHCVTICADKDNWTARAAAPVEVERAHGGCQICVTLPCPNGHGMEGRLRLSNGHGTYCRRWAALALAEVELGENWQSFPGDSLPEQRRYVLVQVAASPETGMPPSVVVGYLKFGSDGPYFVLPGFGLGRAIVVTHWADCLGDKFNAPLWIEQGLRPPPAPAAPPLAKMSAEELDAEFRRPTATVADYGKVIDELIDRAKRLALIEAGREANDAE